MATNPNTGPEIAFAEPEPELTGPLAGVRVLEVGGIGPNPFAGMVLADMGADVIRLDRQAGTGFGQAGRLDPSLRGRQTLELDLKSDHGRQLALALADRADALIEGFRPGVMERLGLGPEQLLERNPRLVYGRITGFGQHGPMAAIPGHDLNYLALSGVLGASRRAGERPMFAINTVGDYGGGAMMLAFGVVCALLEARSSGRGQVIDAAMVDGSALLLTMVHALRAAGGWSGPPGTNVLDSGAHFYEVYATADGGHVAVGAIEPQFYARLLELLELDADELPQWQRERWTEFKERFAAVFATRTTREWQQLLEHEEACANIVQGTFDAAGHPHMAARGTFVELDGIRQPAAAPRFSRTPARARSAQDDPGAALRRWGVEPRSASGH
ncbi:MAG TPA: CaiB/BaiF CoA-transferase family protein [Solirubrobacteraceae bacterium]|jgi:alpha-methylacyl-CoA racemase|nr:CaiB/BaiF CoA-transferase family protein [Solirubrobacteraceae bacterium]